MASMNTKPDNDAMPANPDCCPTIYLNDDQCEALGITSPPVPGRVYHLEVVGEAVSVTATKEEGDETAAEGKGPDVSLTLKLTDITITDSSKSAAEVLYGA